MLRISSSVGSTDGSAEHKLWCAVVDEAYSCALGSVVGCKSKKKREEMINAQLWFLSTVEGPGTFLWVCKHIGICPDPIIKQLGD